MSTRASIKYHFRTTNDGVGYHLYDDVMDGFGDDAPAYEDTPVYLEVEGVHVEVETLESGKAVVTIVLPRGTARALGLLEPSPAGRCTAPADAR